MGTQIVSCDLLSLSEKMFIFFQEHISPSAPLFKHKRTAADGVRNLLFKDFQKRFFKAFHTFKNRFPIFFLNNGCGEGPGQKNGLGFSKGESDRTLIRCFNFLDEFPAG